MLYSNVKVRSQEKEMETGVKNIIEIGHYGRGRQMLKILSDNEITIKKGDNAFSIVQTEKGEHKIIKENDKNNFMLISTEIYNKTKVYGTIRVPSSHKDNLEIIAIGKGIDENIEYDGEFFDSKIKYWKAYLLKIKGDCIIEICYSSSKKEYLYVIDNSIFKIKKFDQKQAFRRFELEEEYEKWIKI